MAEEDYSCQTIEDILRPIGNLNFQDGAQPCRIGTLIIEHRDNLNRPLPDGIKVRVYDAEDNDPPSYAVIKDGRSKHQHVRCGQIYWQLPRMDNGLSDGYMLYKTKLLEQADWQESADPLRQLIDPMMIDVSANKGEHHLEAIYTPPPIVVNLRNRETDRSSAQRDDDKVAIRLRSAKAAQNQPLSGKNRWRSMRTCSARTRSNSCA